MAQLATKAAQDLQSTQTDLVRAQKEKADAEAALQKLGAEHSKLKTEKAHAEAELQKLDADFLQLKSDRDSLAFETSTRVSDLERDSYAATENLRVARDELARLGPIEEEHRALQAAHKETRVAVAEGLSQLVASSNAIAAVFPQQAVTNTDADVSALRYGNQALANEAWILVVKQLRACAAVVKFATGILLASDDAVKLLRWLSEHGVAVPPGVAAPPGVAVPPGDGNAMDDAHSLVTSAYMVAGKALGGSLVLALTLQGQIGLVGHIADPAPSKGRAREIAQGRLSGVIDALRHAFESSSIDMAQVRKIDDAIADLRTGISEPTDQDSRPPPATPSAQDEAVEAERKDRLRHYKERLAMEWPVDAKNKFVRPPDQKKKKTNYTGDDTRMAGLMAEGYVPEEFVGLLPPNAVAKRTKLLGTPNAPIQF